MGNAGVWSAGTRRRIVCRPGMNTFIVQIGSAREAIEVDVHEQQLTPVMISISNDARSWGSNNYGQISFNLRLIKQAPVAYVP